MAGADGRNTDGPVRRRRTRTTVCWAIAAGCAGWAVLRLAAPARGPLVQALAFTPYAALAALAGTALLLGLRRWRPALLAGLAALALAGAVLPRMLPDPGPAAGGPTVRVLTANLWLGNADPGALVDLVRDNRVDVLTVQEFTPDIAAALDRLGLAELLPYRQLNPEVGSTGSGLYSRFPIAAGGIRRNAGGFSQAHGTIRPPGAAPVVVESAHPMAPYALSAVGDWRTDLTAEPRATPEGTLRILAGDFNATLDHPPLRALLGSGYADAADRVGAGWQGTWGPYDGDLIPPVAIDHVLVDRRIAVRAVGVHRLPHSDHRALLAELALPAG
ncbi:endonuclease/exonuclease/phosphatase family protein [Plantactinospora sp. KBS50]|uniref:endonuclease/exonuclease/phosphatase family protein n=1 Tax=Plantactinospora sp. KBS50 TaxID=2024580 RepID=UPI000BAB23DF|nr:endonuclease/exonuclease/phosphatase family protein [Plantactinospora sp. KBS50]ASW53955.1 endonuclease [Plantactinospora sp. KBS50]